MSETLDWIKKNFKHGKFDWTKTGLLEGLENDDVDKLSKYFDDLFIFHDTNDEYNCIESLTFPIMRRIYSELSELLKNYKLYESVDYKDFINCCNCFDPSQIAILFKERFDKYYKIFIKICPNTDYESEFVSLFSTDYTASQMNLYKEYIKNPKKFQRTQRKNKLKRVKE